MCRRNKLFKEDDSFGATARIVGPIPVLRALSEVWQVVGSFLGLSGGFCFFVVMSDPVVKNTPYLSEEVAQSLVVGSLAVAFSCSYLGAGWCMTFIGNAAYIVKFRENDKCNDEALIEYIAHNEALWSFPAYMNFVVVLLTMFSLAIFSFSTFQPAVSIFFGVFAVVITLTGFLVTRRVLHSRMKVVLDFHKSQLVEAGDSAARQ